MKKDCTIICRCEDVTLEEIDSLIKKGYHRIDEIKKVSRCGMGICQGRCCQPLVARRIATVLGKQLEKVEPPKSRPPFKPVPLATLAKQAEH